MLALSGFSCCTISTTVGMACEARSGLKLSFLPLRQGATTVGMACEARSGLKLGFPIGSVVTCVVGMACEARSGLKPSFRPLLCFKPALGWPVKPVRD